MTTSDVSILTDVIASSSDVPLEQLVKDTSRRYLANLTALGLQELLSEPTILQTQAHHLTSSLTSLTHTSYPTFLSLHQTTNALTSSLTSLSSSLDALLSSSLPALEECAVAWKSRTDAILRQRNRARVVLEQNEKIRDLLEIPILIDTCVRNGYFAEALSLVSHAKALVANATAAKKPSIIISSVLAEVHHSIMQMLVFLVATLHEPNRKLPALWKSINFLRKMDAFGFSSPFALPGKTDFEKNLNIFSDNISNEEQIALAFLLGRESCLRATVEACGCDISRMTNHGVLDDREQEDLARYLKKYIDLWREGVYDIMTQYSTIFLEKPSSTFPLSPTKVSHSQSPNNQAVGSEWIQLQYLITSYSSRALTLHLFPTLASSLSFLSISQLQSLLTQLTYCSTAFSRMGLDFRGILSSLFSHAVIEVVSNKMRTVGDKFISRFKTTSSYQSIPANLNGNPKMKMERPSKWLITSAASSLPPVPVTPASSSGASFGRSPPHIPPQILASYPPLAEHTNALLGILNHLRLLAPMAILSKLICVLDDEILSKGGEALLLFVKEFLGESTSRSSFDGTEINNRQEKSVVMAFVQVYFGILVPFIRRALVEGLYGVTMDTNFEGGELLPNIVMDWEDFVLEYEA